MQLNQPLLQVFGQGRVFKDNQGRINSVAFHRSEDLMVTAGDDDSIHLYNINSGTMEKVIQSKKHGAAHLSFTHHPAAVIYASRKGSDHQLRYLSLYDNQYVRYFGGHTGRVTGVTMSPKNDLFLSAAEDKEVRLWDLRVNACQGLVRCPAQPAAAFDEQGLVFAIAAACGVIKLYDVRSYDKGPFATFAVSSLANTAACFASISFSSDGTLLQATTGSSLFVLDAFEGTVKSRHCTGAATGAPTHRPSFSADSKFITSGCDDRIVRTWSIETGAEVAAMAGHAGVPAVVGWAPRRLLLASACDALCMWVPNIQNRGQSDGRHAVAAPSQQQQQQQQQGYRPSSTVQPQAQHQQFHQQQANAVY